jgi:hypothetical protein
VTAIEGTSGHFPSAIDRPTVDRVEEFLESLRAERAENFDELQYVSDELVS